MQPRRHDLFDRGVSKVRVAVSGKAIGLTLTAGFPANASQMLHDFFGARCQRARQFAAQDEEFGNQPRLQAFAIEPTVGVIT